MPICTVPDLLCSCVDWPRNDKWMELKLGCNRILALEELLLSLSIENQSGSEPNCNYFIAVCMHKQLTSKIIIVFSVYSSLSKHLIIDLFKRNCLDRKDEQNI